jgi:hypothetical protein
MLWLVFSETIDFGNDFGNNKNQERGETTETTKPEHQV